MTYLEVIFSFEDMLELEHSNNFLSLNKEKQREMITMMKRNENEK